MNDPTIKHSAPGEDTPGSGQAAHEAQLRTTQVYAKNLSTSTPNFDNEIVLRYWHQRATDCLHRAWVHHQEDNQVAVDKDLADYFNCRTQSQGIEQEGKQ